MPGQTLVEGTDDRNTREAGYLERLYRLFPAAEGRLLAEGGMGGILLVRGLGAGRDPCVVKLLRPELLDADEPVRRFRTELLVHRRLSHSLQAPRLVPCLDVVTGDDPALMAGLFQYFPQGSLREFAERSPAPDAATLIQLLADAAEGLGALHGHGYVHRDVCPKNILVAEEGNALRARLGDLGVALPLRAGAGASNTFIGRESSLRAGHRGYVDPKFYGTRQGDLFGLGASLYWIVTGRDPSDAVPEGGLTVSSAGRFPPGLTGRIDELLRKLTCADPEERFPTATAARDALLDLARRCRDENGRSGRPSPGREGSGRRAAGGNRLLRTAAVAALAAALGGGGALLLVTRHPREDGARHPVPRVASRRDPEKAAASDGSLRGTGDVAAPPARESADAPGTTASPDDGARHGAAVRPDRHDREARRRQVAAMEAAAMEALRRGDEEAARRALAGALRLEPEQGDLRLTLARLLGGTGRIGEALALVRSAPARTTQRAALESLAVTLERLGRREE